MSEFDVRNHFKKIAVLDKGSVELTDGMVADPLIKMVNSARVSFQKEITELSDADIKLIKFLRDHEHFSTLRHSYFSFRIKAPLSTFRQWWKYQIGSNWEEREPEEEETLASAIIIPETNWNEASGRYVEFLPEFYVPNAIRKQSKNNKQGSDGVLEVLENGEDPVAFFEKSCMRGYEDYSYLVRCGAAKEQARGLLSQFIYTECIWTCSLQTIIYFLHQRMKKDAQYEIRQYAEVVWELVKPMINILKEEGWSDG